MTEFVVMFGNLSLNIDVDLWWTVCKHNFRTFQNSDLAVGVLLLIVALAILPFLFHFLVCAFLYREQDLKRKYDASWALITGSSSGIGKALAERLLQQDMNVCLVALGDDVFKSTLKELQEKYPSCQVRGIFADLSSPAFMPNLIEQTKDIVPQVIPEHTSSYPSSTTPPLRLSSTTPATSSPASLPTAPSTLRSRTRRQTPCPAYASPTTS